MCVKLKDLNINYTKILFFEGKINLFRKCLDPDDILIEMFNSEEQALLKTAIAESETQIMDEISSNPPF